jgi:hypothetical protein
MIAESSSQEHLALFRLQVTAEPDPNVLSRVLERFQNLNILPRSVMAELGVREVLHIRIDVLGLDADRMTIIAAKLNEGTNILAANWHCV